MEGRMLRRGDIYYIRRLGVSTVGCEQYSGRPGIIVSNDEVNKTRTSVEVVYLTTNPTRSIDKQVVIRSAAKTSYAICEQVTTADYSRVGDYYGHVTDEEMIEIEKGIIRALDLNNEMRRQECKENGEDEKVMQNWGDKGSMSVLIMERDMYKKLYEEFVSKMLDAMRNVK